MIWNNLETIKGTMGLIEPTTWNEFLFFIHMTLQLMAKSHCLKYMYTLYNEFPYPCDNATFDTRSKQRGKTTDIPSYYLFPPLMQCQWPKSNVKVLNNLGTDCTDVAQHRLIVRRRQFRFDASKSPPWFLSYIIILLRE